MECTAHDRHINMSKQSSITGFVVSKPDTPKRKRDSKISLKKGIVSPSQSSPDNKKPIIKPKTKDTPKQQPSMTLEDKEEIKSKHRGRPSKDKDASPKPISTLSSTFLDTTLTEVDEEQQRKIESKETKMDMIGLDMDKKKDNQCNAFNRKEQKEEQKRDVSQNSKKDGKKEDTKMKRNDESDRFKEIKDKKLSSNNQENKEKDLNEKEQKEKSGNPMAQLSFKAALTKLKSPILPQYKGHRVHVSFAIKLPKNKAKRTEYLAKGLNKFLMEAKKVAPSNRTIYVRKYKEHSPISDTEKPQWIDSFESTNVTHLMNYTHGFYVNQALRNGTFRLSLQLVVPITTDINTFLENINGIWGDTNQMLRNSSEQLLYEPRQIGWFLRSNWNLTASSEFQDTLEKLAKEAGQLEVHFGVQWKTIPSPGNKREEYNKDTAIRAVVVSTNRSNVNQAWKILFDAYNSGKEPPGGMDMHFVPTKDHPDIRNNQNAVHNITYLMESQRIFKDNTQVEECYALANPDREYKDGITLKNQLLRTRSRVMGLKKRGAKLFHSITTRERDGVKAYFFTFHQALAKEATSIIAGLPSFLMEELKTDPTQFCYPTHINEEHQWITETRTIKNSTVDFLSSLAGRPKTMTDEDEEDESYEMDSQCEREFRRTVGLDDSETVANLGTQKTSRRKKVPKQVGSDGSVQTEMSGLTNFTSASKASQHRKDLRKTIDDQRIHMEEQADIMAKMQEQMMAMMQAVQAGGKLPETFSIPQIQDIKDMEDVDDPTKNDDEEFPKAMIINLPEEQREDGQEHISINEEEQSTQVFDTPEDQDTNPSIHTEEHIDDEKEEMPIGNTFTDPDGLVWETGSQLTLDNPKGEHRQVDDSWFQVTSGVESAARAYAMKMYREGQDIVISRTGAMNPTDVVVYVIVHENDVTQEQDSGQGSNPDEAKVKVGFQTTSEVQEYDPTFGEIKGGSEIINTKKGISKQDSLVQQEEPVQTTNSQNKIPMEESSVSTEENEATSSEESSDTNESSSSSSQSPGDTEKQRSKTATKKSERKQNSSNVKIPPKENMTHNKRVKNITRDVIGATAKMKKSQAEKKATPSGKQKAPSGRGSGLSK